jgi:hypothetical protein
MWKGRSGLEGPSRTGGDVVGGGGAIANWRGRSWRWRGRSELEGPSIDVEGA